MFCALAACIECCKTEGSIDVFQVVKVLRNQKPGAVPTLVSHTHSRTIDQNNAIDVLCRKTFKTSMNCWYTI